MSQGTQLAIGLDIPLPLIFLLPSECSYSGYFLLHCLFPLSLTMPWGRWSEFFLLFYITFPCQQQVTAQLSRVRSRTRAGTARGGLGPWRERLSVGAAIKEKTKPLPQRDACQSVAGRGRNTPAPPLFSHSSISLVPPVAETS